MLPPYSIKSLNNGLFYNHQLAMNKISIHRAPVISSGGAGGVLFKGTGSGLLV
jgi:hypothetical protein